MRKKSLLVMIILCCLFIAWLPSQGESGEVYGCYKKKNGKLRIVDDPSQCRKKERSVTLSSDESNGCQKAQLSCVTGYIVYADGLGSSTSVDCNETILNVENYFSEGNFCGGITNKQNITVEDFNDVFTVRYSTDGSDNIENWGLSCNDGWVNTSCIQSVRGSSPQNVDLTQASNGCSSNDEELNYLSMGVTCCKIVQNGDNEDEILELLKNHTHTYRTGKGKGHNNTSADTSSPDL